jgi:hypothetical protein
MWKGDVGSERRLVFLGEKAMKGKEKMVKRRKKGRPFVFILRKEASN